MVNQVLIKIKIPAQAGKQAELSHAEDAMYCANPTSL